MFRGLRYDINVALQSNISVAGTLELDAAAKISLKAAIGVERTATKVNSDELNKSETDVAIKSGTLKLDETETVILSGTLIMIG
jgi:hypothetical protein